MHACLGGVAAGRAGDAEEAVSALVLARGAEALARVAVGAAVGGELAARTDEEAAVDASDGPWSAVLARRAGVAERVARLRLELAHLWREQTRAASSAVAACVGSARRGSVAQRAVYRGAGGWLDRDNSRYESHVLAGRYK